MAELSAILRFIGKVMSGSSIFNDYAGRIGYSDWVAKMGLAASTRLPTPCEILVTDYSSTGYVCRIP